MKEIKPQDTRVMMLGPQRLKANSTLIFCNTVWEPIHLDGLYVLPQLLDVFSFNDVKIGRTSIFYGPDEERKILSTEEVQKKMTEYDAKTSEQKYKEYQEQIVKNREMFSSHCKENLLIIGKPCEVGQLIIVSVSNYSDREETFHANLLGHVGEES